MNFRLAVVSFVFLIGILSAMQSTRAAHEHTNGSYVLFVAQGCTHCAVVEHYLSEQSLPEGSTIEIQDIRVDTQALSQYQKVSTQLGIPLAEQGVPLLLTPDNRGIQGDTAIVAYFDSVLYHITPPETYEQKETVCSTQDTSCSIEQGISWWVVVSAAFADAINPCAFAVLILLMTSMLATGDRRRALYTGMAFVGTIFVSYLAIGLGLYQALATFTSTYWLYISVGCLAILVGLFNIKDALWYGKGFFMEVPVSWRPRMKQLIRSITSPLGAVLIALCVSLFLLPCTSGPYIVIIGMLSQSETTRSAISYLVLYNIVFVLPMLIITYGTYAGVSVRRAESLRQHHIRLVHAITGIIMLGIGIWTIFSVV